MCEEIELKRYKMNVVVSDDILEYGAMVDRIAELEKQNRKMYEWIRHESEISDICTFDVLNEICKGCGCGKGENR